MSLRAAARLMVRMANASGVMADNLDRAREAAGGIPGLGGGDRRSGASGGTGGDGGTARGDMRASSASGATAGGGSTGPVANRDALSVLWKILAAVEVNNHQWDKSARGGTIRRMSW